MQARLDARIARARRLANDHPTAASLLTFYASLAERQKVLLGGWTPTLTGSFIDTLDIDRVLSAIPAFLSWLQHEHSTPAPLVTGAAEMLQFSQDRWRQLVQSYLKHESRISNPADKHETRTTNDGKRTTTNAFVVEAVVQPFADATAREQEEEPVGPRAHTNRCPICGGRPLLGVLRQEGHGAKRGLLCALCFTEWDYLRVVCPACGEQRFDELPVYTAEQFPHVRIDACESCRTYLKTIDLTKDGLAVPIVDDIASVALDLWARDQGYVRLRANLLQF